MATVAFPAISTGAYMYLVEKAAEVALETVKRFLENHPGELEEVRFVLFSEDDFEAWKKKLEKIL
ncbi:MAG: hypothetical protein SVV03_06710 [Candidatus Nanohaloarchaea archaeon]|nr:hypothetical protein [Candidatus Nanohaloarchaea archaeon]